MRPEAKVSLTLLVAKDSAIQTAADLKPGVHKVAVKLATTGHQWARAEMPGLQLVTLDNAANCAMEVVQGKVDAFIYDQISIYQFWKKFENERSDYGKAKMISVTR